MQEMLRKEQEDRFKEYGYDYAERLTEEEAAELLMEESGKAVLLK